MIRLMINRSTSIVSILIIGWEGEVGIIER